MFRVDNAIDGVHANMGCYLCGAPNKLIDTEITIPYEGVLAICESCCRDLAQTAGYNLEITVADYTELRNLCSTTITERDSAEQTLAEIYSSAQAATKRYKERERKAQIRAAR